MPGQTTNQGDNMKFVTMMLLVATLSGFAADTPQSTEDAKKQEKMKAFMQYSTPGDAHKKLGQLAGKWKYTSKWWETAESKPEESKGTSDMKMIMGGRFL